MGHEVRVLSKPLSDFTKEVFVQAGMPPEDAQAEADVLIWANLRGVDSHGVLRIPWYVSNIDKEIMNPKPNIRVEKETYSTLLIDADSALGAVVTTFAMNRVMEKAKKMGIGWALIRNLTHQGALGYYSLMAAKKGMAGITFVCSSPNMVPYGAKATGVSNNPIAISVPARRHRPLILDMATSVVAGGKLWLAMDKGVPIPEGWALNNDGSPTTDPRQYNMLLPVGGPKGSGLSIMLECLSSIMANNPLVEPVLRGEEPIGRVIQNSVVAAVDIGMFTDLGNYKEHVDSLIDGLKALPKAEGFNEILVPGEPEWRTFDDRSRDGIPLPEGTVDNLRSIAKKFSIELPAGL